MLTLQKRGRLHLFEGLRTGLAKELVLKMSDKHWIGRTSRESFVGERN